MLLRLAQIASASILHHLHLHFRNADLVSDLVEAGKHAEALNEELREARDKTLQMPELILPSVQVNLRAGRFPSPEDNGIAYLKIPLNAV